MSSIAEVLAVLDSVREQLLQAHRGLTEADELIGESLAVLSKIGKHHSESLTPPELLGASTQHQRSVELLGAALDRVEGLMTSL
ncbi:MULTISPECIES: hypothetical protein [unclassified Crossiella]|uniref:hypothetical protein n=1 Tax=unclassified Crossiella TaxID=2620835 RepID=UPI0020004463|nr:MULTISPECIES: hypothetical protein [unclassified Crossiella]MCK2238025.1 hypothetical protein [Crossiella sp. S99.2]MCK2255308.1 hypothetical protein [Crossiella sp. S99.1]